MSLIVSSLLSVKDILEVLITAMPQRTAISPLGHNFALDG